MAKEMSERDKELVEKFRKKFVEEILPLMQAALDEIEERGIQEGEDPQELAKLERMHRKVRNERERSRD